nr:MAG TPA: hypothetical protein [Caudoviricetes sp.]
MRKNGVNPLEHRENRHNFFALKSKKICFN